MRSTLCTAPMRHPRAAGDPAVIDIGPAMVQVARRNVADGTARFQVCAFEDFAGSGPFDLIVPATALLLG